MDARSDYRNIFTLSIKGTTVGSFSSVHTLDPPGQTAAVSKIDAFVLKQKNMERRRTGHTKWGDIVLKRGYSEQGGTTEVDSLALKQKNMERRRTGQTKWGDIVLKRGYSEQGATTKIEALTIKQKAGESALGTVAGNTPLVLHAFSGGQNPAAMNLAGAKPGEIVLWDAAGKPIARYHFTNAWPSKVPPGSSGGDLVLLVEGLQRVPAA